MLHNPPKTAKTTKFKPLKPPQHKDKPSYKGKYVGKCFPHTLADLKATTKAKD